MFTFLIALGLSVIMGLILEKGDVFKHPFKLVLIIFIFTFSSSVIINLIRLKTLETKISVVEKFNLEPILHHKTISYVFTDSIRTKDSAGLETIKVKTETYKSMFSIPFHMLPKTRCEIGAVYSKIGVGKNNLIYVSIKKGTRSKTLILDSTTVLIKEDVKDFKLSYYVEEYVGDNWSSSICLPRKSQFYALRIPLNDTIVSEKVFNNYKPKKEHESFIAKHSF